MNGKTLAITGALTLGLLAPAGTALAATTDDDAPLGGVLGIFDRGDRDDRDRRGDWDDRKKNRKDDWRNTSTFRLSGEIRSIDTDDREIRVDLGDRNRTVRVDEDAKIWRDGERARLRDLERGDDVRIAGEKRDGRWVAERIVADD
jgi:hypothetical protein